MADRQRANGLAATIDAGGVALGMLDNTYSPTVVEFCGELGLDFVWLDLEHGGPDPWDAGAIENLLRAAERTDIEPLVRLPDTDPTPVRRALDLGVRNVFLPRVRDGVQFVNPGYTRNSERSMNDGYCSRWRRRSRPAVVAVANFVFPAVRVSINPASASS